MEQTCECNSYERMNCLADYFKSKNINTKPIDLTLGEMKKNGIYKNGLTLWLGTSKSIFIPKEHLLAYVDSTDTPTAMGLASGIFIAK